MEEKKHIIQYDFIKAIAMILVFLGHGLELSFIESTNVGPHNFPYFNVAHLAQKVVSVLQAFIYGFHMPLFVAVTGAVFALSVKESTNAKKWTLKRLKRILVPYLIVGIAILVPVRYAIGYYASNENFFSIVFNDIILAKDCNYLWYLLMIFEVGFIMMLLYKKIKNSKLTYKLILLFVLLILSVASNLFPPMPFQISRTCQYMFWYYIGMLFEMYRNTIINIFKNKINAFIILSITYIIGFVFYRFLLNIVETEMYTGLLLMIIKLVKMGTSYLLAGIGCLSVVVVCFNINKENNFLEISSKNSFCIYLWHSIFMFVTCKMIYMIIPASKMTNLLFGLCILIKIIVSAIMCVGMCLLANTYNKHKCSKAV